MRTSHFVVQTVAGVMIAACGKAIGPRETKSAQVGLKGEACSTCKQIADDAWVTISGA